MTETIGCGIGWAIRRKVGLPQPILKLFERLRQPKDG